MILCLGPTPVLQRTMVFRRLELDAVNRARRVHQFASGKSINAARVLMTLAAPVTATGFLGGTTGESVRDDLRRNGIAQAFVSVPAPTRTCVTVIDEAHNTATELIEESRPVEPGDYDRLLEQLRQLLPAAKLLVCSGTLTPDAPQDFYARCVEAAAQAGVQSLLDTRGQPLREALPQRPLIAKPNRAELAETLAMSVDTEPQLRAAMRAATEAGAQWVVVTDGPRPVTVTDGPGFWKLTPPPIEPVSPIGSGDAFAGGLAAALVRGQPVPEACRLAVACAAANALGPHAGHVEPDEVTRLHARVRLELAESTPDA
jgi:tagatose 6-phosphate kinase